MMELTISVALAQYYIERNCELYAAGWLTNRRRGSGAERNACATIKLGYPARNCDALSMSVDSR
jgi:hypothetical protein